MMQRRATNSEPNGLFAQIKATLFKHDEFFTITLPFFLGILFLSLAFVLLGFVPSDPSSLRPIDTNFPITYNSTSAVQHFIDAHKLLKLGECFRQDTSEQQPESLVSKQYANVMSPVDLSKRIGRLRVKLLPPVNITELLEVKENGLTFQRFWWSGSIKLEEDQFKGFGNLRGWFELEPLTADDFLNGDKLIYRSSTAIFSAKLSEIRVKELRKEEQYGSCEGVAIVPRDGGAKDSKMFGFFYGCAS